MPHQSYLAAAREVAERPSDRRAGLVLPAVRKLALLAALCTRGARVFVRQSSETPGALELASVVRIYRYASFWETKS